MSPERVQGSILALLCIAALLLSAALVRAMIRVAVIDVPGHRSSHDRPTPKGGGVGVVAAFLLGLGLLRIDAASLSILIAVAMLALVSWLDDLRQFPPLVKLGAQAVAAIIVLAGIGPLPLHPPLGLLAGFCWLLFATNALNFIDGLNGLAAGSMALGSLFIGLTAPTDLETCAGCVLAAALLGFLPFNYPRAAIFLGDVGSQGAGLAVGSFGLLRWQDPLPGSMLVMPLLLFGILYDVAFTLCRRLLARERLSQAHRGHLYQVGFRTGVPAFAVALLHWGFVSWGAGLAWLLSATVLDPWLALLLAMLPQLAWTGFVIDRSRRKAMTRW